MLVEREELLGLLGPKAVGSPGRTLEFTLPESSRRARIERDGDGAIYADVTEGLDGDSVLVVVLRATPAGTGFDAEGEDRSGEASEPRDPRAAAAAWRRLVNPMSSRP